LAGKARKPEPTFTFGGIVTHRRRCKDEVEYPKLKLERARLFCGVFFALVTLRWGNEGTRKNLSLTAGNYG